MRVTLSVPVRPTEDEGKVVAAVRRLFPGLELRPGPAGTLSGTGADLDAFRARVWELRIIDTVRGQLLHGLAADGRSLSFRLAKQAAAAGKVSFPPTPHPLGDVAVTLEVGEGDPWPDAEALAWWVCPETRDGEIVGPR